MRKVSTKLLLPADKRTGPLSVFYSNSVLTEHHTRLLLHSFSFKFMHSNDNFKVLLWFSWQWGMLFLFLIKIKIKHCLYNRVANELGSCSFINNGIQFCLHYSNYELIPTFFSDCGVKFHIVCFVYSARWLRLLKIQQNSRYVSGEL